MTRRGRFSSELAGIGEFVFDLGQATGQVHVFRFQDQSELLPDGEQRLVPVSLKPPVLPEGLHAGTECLRIERSAQGLNAEDVIFEVQGHPIEGTVLLARAQAGIPRFARLISVDGVPVRRIAELHFLPETKAGAFRRFEFQVGDRKQIIEAAELTDLSLQLIEPLELVQTTEVRAKVYSGGEILERMLQPGLALRHTACPLLFDRKKPYCNISSEKTGLEQGNYLVLVESPGYRPIRCILSIQENKSRMHRIDPFTVEEVPVGFRLVHRTKSLAGSRIFLMDHEVTSASYLEFLNRPETLAFIASSPIPTRFPRFTENAGQGGYWPKKDGRYVIPTHWKPEWPMLGISWNDAKAFTQWKTSLAHKEGKKIRFRLPDSTEWAIAAWSEGFFVFGNQFRQHWLSSCNSLPKPGPEAVMSYCVDESPLGIFDMSGSAFEYAEGWFWKDRRRRPLLGGSWAMADPEKFRASYWTGAGEDAAWDTYGFRMIMEEEDG